MASIPCRTKRLVYIHGEFDSVRPGEGFLQISVSIIVGLDLYLSLAREFEVELYSYPVNRDGRLAGVLPDLTRSRVLSWTRANGIVRQVCESNGDLPPNRENCVVNTWREFLGV